MYILITGSAGFIGMGVSRVFLEKGYKIIGVDNLNSYYDLKLKKDRNKEKRKYKNYKFFKLDLSQKTLKDKAIEWSLLRGSNSGREAVNLVRFLLAKEN